MMAEHKPLYRYSRDEAERLGELDDWRASHAENVACRDDIAQSIGLNYDGSHLGGQVADHAIAKFGFDRVHWVLANTVQLKDEDGRFSAENKAWAKKFFMPGDERYRRHFLIDDVNPGLVDMVARDARQAYEQLGLFDAEHCQSVYDFEDVTGQVLVLKPDLLADELKKPESQLFLADHGYGCIPTARGRSIFGSFLADGEKDRFWRSDFLGVLKPEHMPAWAIEKLRKPEPEPDQAPESTWIKLYQINLDRDTERRRFEPLAPGQAVDPSIYDEVYDGPVQNADPEAIYARFNGEVHPPLHRGCSMSVSDVIEMDGKHLFVDRAGFSEIDFDAAMAQKPEDLLRVVVLEPGLPAYEGEIGPDLKSMQRAVGGHIEITCPFDDAVAVVGNEEAKLNGMEGNHRIAGQVYAGPLIIAGDTGEGDLCSLTEEQAANYRELFAVPEDISQEQVQADMGMQFYG